MTGALIILLVTAAVGLFLYMGDLRWRRTHGQQKLTENGAEEADKAAQTPSEAGHGPVCCGRHLICEKGFSPLPGEKPLYYDDEELDLYAGRNADSYSDEEIEQFRDIIITLNPEDAMGWARSLQLRDISLPLPLRDEFLLLLEAIP